MESSFVLVLTVLLTTLLDRASGQFLEASKNPVAVGNNVTLHSNTTVNNGIWLFDSRMLVFISPGVVFISDPWKTRAEYHRSTSSLTLRSATLQDSGVYSLQGAGIPHRADLTLSVQVPVANVTLRANALDLVEHNDTAVLMSSVSSGTSLSYKWMKNGTMVTAGGNVEFSDGNANLTINNVKRQDEGSYTCTVSNGLNNETSQPVNLNVSYGPDTATMTVLSTTTNHHKTGSNITLMCSAESRPPAIVQWMFNGVPLNHSDTKLEIKNLTLSHSGDYECLFHNPVTGRYSSANAFISTVDPISSVEINVTEPAILGRPFTQHCAVSGPVDATQWWKNGSMVYADNTTTFGPNNQTLTFDPVQRSDNGDYQCLASNRVSDMTSSPQTVQVNYGPETPVINGPTKAETGSNEVFTCSAMSVPPSTYTWMYKESVIANTSQLMIYNLTLNMSGQYTCVAHNSITGEKRNSTNMLTVFEVIESVRIRTNSTPILDKHFTLICDVVGPYDTIYWMKNNMTLTMGGGDMNATNMNTTNMNATNMNTTNMNATNMNTTNMNATNMNTTNMNATNMNTTNMNATNMNTTTNMNITNMNTTDMNTTNMNTTNDPNMTSHQYYRIEKNMLHFTPLTLESDGTYCCVAKNEYHQQKSPDYDLLVNYGPLNVSISGPESTKENSNVTLTCFVDSRPESTYRWYLENATLMRNASVLTFSAAQKYEGFYTCEATNPVTNITKSATHMFSITISSSIIHLPSQASVMLTTLLSLSATRLFY